MEYTTLENLKEYLGITDTNKDILLSKIITRVSAMFDNYLGRNLGIQTYEEYIDTNDDLIITTFGPIRTIQELKDENGNPLNYKRINGNLIFLDKEYNGVVYVRYEAGYSNLSEIQDVEQACLSVCKNLFLDSKQEGAIKSKSIEGLSISYFSPTELTGGGINGDYSKILDKYKSFKPLKI